MDRVKCSGVSMEIDTRACSEMECLMDKESTLTALELRQMDNGSEGDSMDQESSTRLMGHTMREILSIT